MKRLRVSPGHDTTPNSIDIRQDLRPFQNRIVRPFIGSDPGAWRAARINIRESETRRRPAGISNVNGVQISRSFSAAKDKATVHVKIAIPG